MTDSEQLTAARLRAALGTTERWLALNRDAVNAINVYPVPDGDTGTNMLLTLRAGLSAVDTAPASAEMGVSTLADRLARGALLGARGNSGVILSQMLRGAAEALAGVDSATADDLLRALRRASDAAYEAVSDPVEGTMLTVLREAAQGAAAATPRGMLEVLRAAETAAQAALERTPELLPRLREAGVVDAGGLGVVTLLAGLRMGVAGEELPAKPVSAGSVELSAMAHTGYGYCTEFVVQGAHLDRDALMRRLAELGGESLLVVGDPTALHVHVHISDPGAAISAGVAMGSVSALKAENMQLQHEEWLAVHEQAEPARQPGLGLVAVTRGSGIAAAFRGLGAVVVMPPEGARASAGELLEAARLTGRSQVLLLPNDGDVLMAAEQAARASDGLITVIPSKTVTSGLSAALAFRADASLAEARAAMCAAMRDVRCIEVTRAARSAVVDGVSVGEGQAMALLDGHAVAAADSLDDALLQAVDVAVHRAPAELITVYLGSNAPIGAEETVTDRLQQAYPDMAIEVLDGGQPHYPYVVGVE